MNQTPPTPDQADLEARDSRPGGPRELLGALRKALADRDGGSAFGVIEWVQQTGSTNRDLMGRRSSLELRTVRLAEHQTAGRGRLDRSWSAEPGGSLLCSVSLEPAPGALSWVTPAMALATVDACERQSAPVCLKWPNDVLSHDSDDETNVGCKVAGILAESRHLGSGTSRVVVGVGINVRRASVPRALGASAACLDAIAPVEIDRVGLAADLLIAFDQRLSQLERAPEELRSDYVDRLATLGQHVRVDLGQNSVEGRATGVDLGGALRVEAGGRVTTVHAGDVVHLRPAEPDRPG